MHISGKPVYNPEQSWARGIGSLFPVEFPSFSFSCQCGAHSGQRGDDDMPVFFEYLDIVASFAFLVWDWLINLADEARPAFISPIHFGC